MSKKTPWLPGDVAPVHPGVYQRKWPDGDICWTRWDTAGWGGSWSISGDRSHEWARTSTPGTTYYQNLPWRGLTTKDGK